MRMLHWCMLAVTFLLLVCEITISQLCKSLITLVDGFHTLFILMCMALPAPKTAGIINSPLQTFTPPAGSSIKPLPSIHPGSEGPTIRGQPPTPQPDYEATSLVNPHQHFSSEISPPALDCGVSHTNSRIRPVGVFISALLLASLCISYLIEIISFFLEPHPVQYPLLLVVVGAVSLLHKMLLLRLNWDQLHDERARVHRQPEVKSHREVKHKAPTGLPKDKPKGQAEAGQAPDDVQPAVDNLFHNEALVLCNPGTSSVPDIDTETPQQPEIHLHAAVPLDSKGYDVANSARDLKAQKCKSQSKDMTEITKDNMSKRHLDNQNASKSSSACKSSHSIEIPVPNSQGPVYLLSCFLVIQGLLTSLLALSNSLVMLLIRPQYLHSTGACRLLVYLDPGLSLLAVIMLLSTARPQLCRYGLLLLQATPPDVCVPELERRIASVPGVQAVHDLHVWQLAESLMVASVHVQCNARFPAHRCTDLMSGVTKVLQSVGVRCCTIQPEFASYSGSSTGNGCDTSPVVHREDPSLPPLLPCSLTCGKACAGSMCCSPLEEKTRSLLAPPACETKEEPQTLVIENTFL